MNRSEPYDERRLRSSKQNFGVPLSRPDVTDRFPGAVDETGDSSKYPQYSKEQCEALGYEPVGVVLLQGTALVITYDENRVVHAFKANTADAVQVRENLGKPSDTTIDLSEIPIENITLRQFDLQSPETREVSRIGRQDLTIELAGKDCFEPGAPELEAYPVECIMDLFFNRGYQGQNDKGDFFDLQPQKKDSLIGCLLRTTHRMDKITIAFIQPELEQLENNKSYFSSELGLRTFLREIIDVIMREATPGQNVVNGVIESVLEQDSQEPDLNKRSLLFDDQPLKKSIERLHDVITLIWRIQSLLYAYDVESKRADIQKDTGLATRVPWIKWSGLNKVSRALMGRAPQVTLRNETWYDLLATNGSFMEGTESEVSQLIFKSELWSEGDEVRAFIRYLNGAIAELEFQPRVPEQKEAAEHLNFLLEKRMDSWIKFDLPTRGYMRGDLGESIMAAAWKLFILEYVEEAVRKGTYGEVSDPILPNYAPWLVSQSAGLSPRGLLRFGKNLAWGVDNAARNTTIKLDDFWKAVIMRFYNRMRQQQTRRRLDG